MIFTLIYERRVCKDLDKIPDRDLERIRDIFLSLRLDPKPQGSKKLSGQDNLYRIRQGNYRIVYACEVKAKRIRVLLVRHRNDVYRSL